MNRKWFNRWVILFVVSLPGLWTCCLCAVTEHFYPVERYLYSHSLHRHLHPLQRTFCYTCPDRNTHRYADPNQHLLGLSVYIRHPESLGHPVGDTAGHFYSHVAAIHLCGSRFSIIQYALSYSRYHYACSDRISYFASY